MDDTITILSTHHCLELLSASEVGRLAVAAWGRPEIFPINYVVDHGTVVFRTAPGTKLAAVAGGGEVAFEVDGYDAEHGEAWSVVVKGRAAEIEAIHEGLDVVDLPLFPWQTGPKPRFVRIVPSEVTGRRFAARRPSTAERVAPSPRHAAVE